MSETSQRIRIAREIIAENRKSALRGLANALNRSYTEKAVADRKLRELDLRNAAGALWDRAFEDVSAILKRHGRERLPLQNRLALLVGFPSQDPEPKPRPLNKIDAKRFDEAVSTWRKLLAEDKAFAARAQAVLDQMQEEIDRRRVQIQIDFTKALNAASDRSQSEAENAVESQLPDFVGGLSQRPDVRLDPEPERAYRFGSVGASATPSELAGPIWTTSVRRR